MPASYTAQTFTGNFVPYQWPTPYNVTTTTVSIDDNDDDGIISPGIDQVGGSDVTGVYNGDSVEYSDGTVITGVTFYTAGGGIYFVPNAGQSLSNGEIISTTWMSSSTSAPVTQIETVPPCFVNGTFIRTANGNVPVEDILLGDLVLTRHNGLRTRARRALIWLSYAKVPKVCFIRRQFTTAPRLCLMWK